MRNAVTGFILLVIIILSGTIILTLETKTTRQNELDMNLGKAMEQTMKSLAADGAEESGERADKEMAADFIENFLVGTTSNSSFQVDVLEADAFKGILDVRVTEKFRQILGDGTAEARKTVVLEQYDKRNEILYKISFYVAADGERDIIKQVQITEGEVMEAAYFPGEDPVKEGYRFKGWMAAEPNESSQKGKIFTKDTADQLAVESDMMLEAVFEKL